MVPQKQNIAAGTDDWYLPLWVKVASTFFALSAWVILAHSLLNAQKAIFGLSDGAVIGVSLGLVLLSIPTVIAVWFFPRSPLVISLYWLIRFLHEQICIFALLGLVYLFSIRASPLSLRGGIATIDLVLLFLLGWRVPPLGADLFPLPGMQRLSTRLAKLVAKINSAPVWLLSILVAILPTLVICLAIYLKLGAGPLDYKPYSFWNDETGYWLWVRSFSHVGLNAGYNAPNELIAPAAFNHYGEGSPLYVYFYGSIGRWIGWFPQLPIFINFVLLALATLLFIFLIKPTPVQIIIIGLITTTTWSIPIYLPMTTQETLHQVIGFVLAIVFFKFLTQREEISLPARIFFVFLVYLAALTRLSWGLLLIPVMFYSLNGNVSRRVFLSVLLGLGLYISVIFITNYLVPPVNNSIFLNMREGFTRGPQIFARQIAGQLYEMFRFTKLNPNTGVTFQLIIIIGWNLMRLVRPIKLKLSTASILQSPIVFDIYTMATLLTAGFLFYLQVGFYRVFTPTILMVSLLQTIRKDYRLLATFLAINVLLLHSYMTFYGKTGDFDVIRNDFRVRDRFPERVQLQTEMEKWIAFDHTTENPWCNTLFIPLGYYDYRLTTIPPGIGFSYGYDLDTLKMPLHSKYLLFDRGTYKLLANRLHVKLLDSSSIGDLYYNLDSDCDTVQ